MRKLTLLCSLALFCILPSTQSHAKVIFLGIEGGIPGFFDSFLPSGDYTSDLSKTIDCPNDNWAAQYPPDNTRAYQFPMVDKNPKSFPYKDYCGYSASYPVASIGLFMSGVNGIAKTLEYQLSESYVARVFSGLSNMGDAKAWLEGQYNQGDYVFMAGHSSGAGHVLQVAKQVNGRVPVHVIGLIDFFSTVTKKIPTNVAKAYVYYQREGETNSSRGTGLHGAKSFDLDSSSTYLKVIKIVNVINMGGKGHTDIDNDPRVWEGLSAIMYDEITGLVGGRCIQSTVPAINQCLADSGNGSNTGTNAGTDASTQPDTSGQGDDNVSIKRMHIRKSGTSSYTRELAVSLVPKDNDRNFVIIEGELDIKNKGSNRLVDVEVEFLIEDQGKNFRSNDTEVDKGENSIDPGRTDSEKMRNVRVKLSDDATYVTVYGNNNGKQEDIPVINHEAKVYFFAQVTAGSDDDISSTNSYDEEYGSLTITIAPRGYVDSYSCETIEGWAWDPDTNNPIDVHIWKDNQSWKSITASTYRSDLDAAGIGNGSHAFELPMPDEVRDGQNHAYKVHGINWPSDHSGNPVLIGGEFTLNCPPILTQPQSPCPGLDYDTCMAAIMVILD